MRFSPRRKDAKETSAFLACFAAWRGIEVCRIGRSAPALGDSWNSGGAGWQDRGLMRFSPRHKDAKATSAFVACFAAWREIGISGTVGSAPALGDSWKSGGAGWQDRSQMRFSPRRKDAKETSAFLACFAAWR